MDTTLKNAAQTAPEVHRRKLIADLPVKEHQVQAAAITTTYLEGGTGTPLVLLHGPGESAVWWMRVIPLLVKKVKVIVPDLPGHGSSGSPGGKISQKMILHWLDEFVQRTCNEPPVLVGHVSGGAMSALYAIQRGDRMKQLILVDSLGLSSFRPAPRFAFEFLRFMIRPDERTYLRFLPQCMYDINGLSAAMGKYWQPFTDYNLCSAQNPEKKAAVKDIMAALSGKISDDKLKKIDIPVMLIWGRHDKANRLKVAIKASKKYGWPLTIIDDARDDPKLERPDQFVRAVLSSLTAPLVAEQE